MFGFDPPHASGHDNLLRPNWCQVQLTHVWIASRARCSSASTSTSFWELTYTNGWGYPSLVVLKENREKTTYMLRGSAAFNQPRKRMNTRSLALTPCPLANLVRHRLYVDPNRLSWGFGLGDTNPGYHSDPLSLPRVRGQASWRNKALAAPAAFGEEFPSVDKFC